MNTRAAAIFLLLLAAAAPATARADTGPGDAFQFVRDLIDYSRYFFVTHESGFNLSRINNEISAGGPAVVLERRAFFSYVLNEEKNYTVLLPPDYKGGNKRYPVYYLLHGAWGDDRTWVMRGNIVRIYQDMLMKGEIGEVIIAMPDGDNAFWENGCVFLAFCGNYEDYFIEFTGEIDTNYRTLAQKQNRGIGGLSLGGRGAMRLAFLHPDRFAFAAGHSGYYDPLLQEITEEKWERLRASNVAIYFDNSRNDLLAEYSTSSVVLNRTLGEKRIPHEYSETDFFTMQSHAWPYWKRQARIAMRKACAIICG